MSITSSFQGFAVKSVQYFTIALVSVASAAATISSVDTTKAVLIYLGASGGTGTNPQTYLARITLTNATTVTANRLGSSVGEDLTVSGVVVEFE